MEKKKVFKKIITHSTTFHADDVFGVAMFKLIDPSIRFIRTLEPEKYYSEDEEGVIVFDIGMGKYDHHQPDKALRPDGTPYCGFGLLWRDYGYLLCPNLKAWEKVDQTLVLPIDKHDNGVARNVLSSMIGSFNPEWNEDKTEFYAFCLALDVAMSILESAIKHANAVVEAEDAVLDYYLTTPREELLVMNRYLPWMDTVQNNPRLKNVLFAIYPSNRGGWCVQTVTKQPGTFVNRMDFPTDWLGHTDDDRGITFAHTANFLIVTKTREQAIAVAEEAIQKGSEYATVAYSI